MSKHTYYNCKCHKVGCQYCDGGLGYCTVCGGFEGSLPTDCPQRKMTENEIEQIYEGQIDYREGRKWVKPDGTGNSMGDYRIAAEERKKLRANTEQSD